MYLTGRLATGNFKVTVPRWTCHPDSESDPDVPGPRRPGGLLRALPDLSATGPPDVQVASGSGTSGSLPQ